MIVSTEKQFVFVHICKTAGNSIKRALRRYAMPRWQECANVALKRIGVPQFGPAPYPDHMTAGEVIAQIGRGEFNSFYSFAFVRNTWDWELSQYKCIRAKRKHPLHESIKSLGGFGEYVRWRCDGRFLFSP